MIISFDPAKRAATLAERGLDFLDADLMLADWTLTFEDERFDYGEPRYISVGFLAKRMVVIGWTPRGTDCHVFSMRKANDREINKYAPLLQKAGKRS
jgi:uncharacterized protein